MKEDASDGNNGGSGKHNSHDSHRSHSFPERLLPPRGDYRTQLSFQKAEIIYDITFRFAHKFLAKGDRTIDQMIQAARSGKKNILEGSKAALTSKETELKPTNIAGVSLEELFPRSGRGQLVPVWFAQRIHAYDGSCQPRVAGTGSQTRPALRGRRSAGFQPALGDQTFARVAIGHSPGRAPEISRGQASRSPRLIARGARAPAGALEGHQSILSLVYRL